MHYRSIGLLCVIMAVLMFGTCAVQAQPYELPLGRQIRVTDVYLLKGTSTQISRLTTVDPSGITKVVKDDTVIVRIDAECEVAGITEDGQEAVKLITIRNAQVSAEGATSDLLPTGTSLKATFSDSGTVITKDGQPLSMDLMAHLATVIRGEGGSRTGSIMDPSEPVSPGDSWPMDSAAFMSSLGSLASPTPRSVEGRITFQRIDTTGVRPAAVVEMKGRAQDAIGNLGSSAPTASEVVMEITVHAPLDKRYPLTATSTRTRLVTTFGSGPGSATVEAVSVVDLRFYR